MYIMWMLIYQCVCVASSCKALGEYACCTKWGILSWLTGMCCAKLQGDRQQCGMKIFWTSKTAHCVGGVWLTQVVRR